MKKKLLWVTMTFVLGTQLFAQDPRDLKEIKKNQEIISEAKVKSLRIYTFSKDQGADYDAQNKAPRTNLSAIWTYDPQGRLIKEEYFEEGEAAFISKSTWNEQGKLIHKADFDGLENLMSETRFKYNEQGRIVAKTGYVDGSEMYAVEFKYDGKGKLIGHLEGGAEPRDYQYQTDKDGNVTQMIGKTVFFIDDQEIWKTVDSMSYEYKKGLLIHGKECYGGGGCVEYKNVYDKKKRLIRNEEMGDYNESTTTFGYQKNSLLIDTRVTIMGEAFRSESPDRYEYFVYEFYK
ncbi:MAG: hypothetical protein EP338_05900 [Bacteroidetes bacterium]|nr:MAG: hypothetical protein EP338_05900 [Bacteroidota bacterium]